MMEKEQQWPPLQKEILNNILDDVEVDKDLFSSESEEEGGHKPIGKFHDVDWFVVQTSK